MNLINWLTSKITPFPTFLKLNNIMPLQNASVYYGVKYESPAQEDTVPEPPEVTSVSIDVKPRIPAYIDVKTRIPESSHSYF